MITVADDGDTTVGGFIGEYAQRPDGTYEFSYGPLIRAMTRGWVLFIDHATLICPAVLAVVYPAMDGRREVIVKAHKARPSRPPAASTSSGGTTPASTVRS